MKNIIVLLFSIILASCVTTKPYTNQFNGKYAVVDDSYRNSGHFGGGTHYFFIEDIDGIKQSNAFERAINTLSNNYNQFGFTRNIAAKNMKITLAAGTMFRTGFNALASDSGYFGVKGIVDFTGEIGKHYLINGVILKDYSAVWIEDGFGNVVSELVELGHNANKFSLTDGQNLNKNNKRKKTRSELFSTIMTGESSQLIIYKFGKPTEVLYPEKNSTFIYQGLGKIKFIRRNDNESFVYMIIPDIDIINLSASSVYSLINPATGRTIRELAKEYYGLNITDIEILDVFADKIWKERNSKDRYMSDGIAWLCKILGQSQNYRYKMLLETLLDSKQSNLKTRHVKASLANLVQKDVPQFKFKS
ncbi:hypothetical protein L3081_19390 [Colwellia sp. MSW7]|uniref:Uncharacterized protein n=1 Tax=Colwellia maritima TaxID=2912588 RepID=A0ABS9X4K2_9GAMM|nr:hypothetical protein [Colwellia maritima]MCI2285154.1 hypothetical protein [Colwellia maritima]